MVNENPKVSMGIPSEWTGISEEVGAISTAPGSKWHHNMPYHLHRITEEPQLRQAIKEAVDKYRKFRRKNLSRKLEQKDQAYDETRDQELNQVKEFLSGEGVQKVRRAHVMDAYPALVTPDDRMFLPEGERDIVAALDHEMDLDAVYEAAQEIGLEPSYIGKDEESIFHDNQKVSVILPDTVVEPDARSGKSVTFKPDQRRYLIGGANHERNGVTQREPGTAYQPFEDGEASWNLKLLREYQEML